MGSYPIYKIIFLKIIVKVFFTLILITGTIIVISATNWISAWVGLELNLLAFIPLIFVQNDHNRSESTLKYFLTQSFASIFLLFSLVIISYNTLFITFIYNTIIIITIALKIGLAPLHFWFPSVIQGLTWINCFILITWQKLAPLILIVNLKNPLTISFAIISAVVGAIGGYNQILIRKILAYSSINHIRWLISSTIIGEKIIIIYFFIYSFLNAIIISITAKWNIRHLSQMPLRKSSKNINSLFITNLLSLGGIPPFLGFLPRWIIVSELITKIPLQISLLTISSLLRLYFYLRITYVIILKSPTQHILLQNSKYNILSAITVLSATALIISVPLL